MKKQFEIFAILNLIFALMASGCALLAIGAAGAAGGYAVSSDGIEGISDKSYEQIWQKASDVLSRQGTIQFTDKEHGTMRARIKNSELKFKMEQATTNSIVVRVQARRFNNLFPDMDLARRIYSMIVKETG